MLTIEDLRRAHAERRPAIQARLREFARISEQGDSALFRELCFCIAAANSSAEMGIKTMEALQDLLEHGTLDEMRERLRGRFRYWNKRPEYIVHTREYIRKAWNFEIQSYLSSIEHPSALRAALAENPDIKGIGYKEASHFLRNVGYRGLAILDKHILATMKAFRIIRKAAPPSSGREYVRLEKRLKSFADSVGVDFDEMDLLLWSLNTGYILK
jgi:N-glycosylase/DNA lyase